MKRFFSVRKLIIALFTGIFVGFMFAAGKVLDTTDSIIFTERTLYIRWLFASLLAMIALYLLWTGFEYISEKQFLKRGKYKIPFIARVGVMLGAWVPVWLSIFPGAFAYDAYDQWKMVAEGSYTAHHPLLHTIFLGGLVEGMHRITGSYNFGIALYTGIQMLVLAVIFSLIIGKLNDLFNSTLLQVFALLFFAFEPVIGLFSVSAIKDTLFCGAEMLFFLYIFEFFSNREGFLNNPKKVVGLAVTGLFTMILRNNGFYIAVIMLAVVFIASVKCFKSIFMTSVKSWIIIFSIIIVPFAIYTGPVYSAFMISEPTEYAEYLSVPIQQMARVYKYDYESISIEDRNLFEKYISPEVLETYKPTVSDNLKSNFNAELFKEDPLKFVKLWASIGKKHPMTYVSSFLLGTVDGWYPGAVIDGYKFEDKSSYFDYRVATPGTEDSKIGWLHEIFRRIAFDADAQKGLGFLLLFSPGWYLLCFIVLWVYGLSHGKRAFVGAGFVHVLHYMTILLGPMALVRYELNFFYGIPVFIWCLAADNKQGRID